MSNEKRNLLIVQFVGIALVLFILWLVSKTPELQNYPFAMATIPTLVGAAIAAFVVPGSKDAITEKLRSMAPEQREQIIQASLRPAAMPPVAITFKGADDEHEKGP